MKGNVNVKKQTTPLTQQFKTQQEYQAWVDKLGGTKELLQEYTVLLEPKNIETGLPLVKRLYAIADYNYITTEQSKKVLFKRTAKEDKGKKKD